MDVAETRHDSKDESGRMDGTAPIPIQGAGIDVDNVMAMDSPEQSRGRTSPIEEEDRGDELGGSDSSLTDLRGTSFFLYYRSLIQCTS